MDSERFDSLTRRLAAPATRRRALGAAATSGFLGVLGLGRSDVARAAQLSGGVCSIPFTTVVRDGPSAGRPLTRGGRPGELSGTLQFSLDGNGNLEQATLNLTDGTSLPVLGQASGFALQTRIQLAPNLAVVAVGVGEQEIAACAGAIDGPSSGPQVGDIGDWHAGSAAQTAAGSGGKGKRNKDNAQGAAGGQGGQGGRGNRARGQGGGQADAGAAGAVGSGGNGGGGRGGGNGGGGGGGRNGGGQGGGNAGGRNSEQQPVPPLADGTCPPQRERCGETCHDLGADPKNCGQCGNACDEGRFEVCENGLCTGVACENNQQYCGPDVGCVSLEGDHDHCGRCGNMCLDSQCVNGVCSNSSAQCADGETLCDGECTDLNFDDLNCGRCGNMCAITDVCTDGVCGPVQCPAGTTLCGMACVNLQTAPQNCGTCEISCAADQFCQAGVCTAITTCSPGATFCRDAGSCRDLTQDNANCGECGVSCVSGFACRGGECIDGGDPTRCVQPGLYFCSGKCVQIEFDANNCGLCGITCAAGQVCQQFSCIASTAATVCPVGQNFCSGACVDLMNDSNNCGMCGTGCGGPQCIQGFCGGPDTGFDRCASNGFTNCNGACVDLDVDSLNCGACGVACLDGSPCVNGSCETPGDAQLQAPADDCTAQNLVRCNGACVDTQADVFNCGGCGSVCGVFDTCVGGMCQAPEDQTQPSTEDQPGDANVQPEDQPADTTDTAPVVESLICESGLVDCNGICADLASDPANCGICGFSCGFDPCVDGLCVAPDTTASTDAPAEIPADVVVEEAPPLIEDCSAQGLTDCGGACIDIFSDPFNCGGCGLICPDGQGCSGGACA